uniref:Uncharacterized protein n=1 Tax=Eutreptiella gymnastica TaxID=73025 RepID=A0A7S4D0S6_9EUGL
MGGTSSPKLLCGPSMVMARVFNPTSDSLLRTAICAGDRQPPALTADCQQSTTNRWWSMTNFSLKHQLRVKVHLYSLYSGTVRTTGYETVVCSAWLLSLFWCAHSLDQVYINKIDFVALRASSKVTVCTILPEPKLFVHRLLWLATAPWQAGRGAAKHVLHCTITTSPISTSGGCLARRLKHTSDACLDENGQKVQQRSSHIA